MLSHASLKMGVAPRLTPIIVENLLHEIEGDAELDARNRTIEVVVSAPKDLVIQADPRLLRSAISNLLQNALKFSRERSKVTLTAMRADNRVTIEVADGCGGLPPGKAAELFTPLVQRGEDRSGFGLGLAIALQAAEAHNGTIKVRDVPGVGCVFVIDLPSSG
ncbi:MAG TPA: HAMP domain-containing sensor histidine kinase [Polyangia bacterium]|nr:HAMP domain-containing sensor histidine kinase [Polyangia bacterium]